MLTLFIVFEILAILFLVLFLIKHIIRMAMCSGFLSIVFLAVIIVLVL